MAEETTNGAAVKVTFTAFKPQLMVPESKADEAVAFHKNTFAAEEVKCVNHPKRKEEQDAPLLLYAELNIGGGSLLVCDQLDDSSIGKTGSNVGAGVVFRLETEDIAAMVAHAVKAGAVLEGDGSGAESPASAKLSSPPGLRGEEIGSGCERWILLFGFHLCIGFFVIVSSTVVIKATSTRVGVI